MKKSVKKFVANKYTNRIAHRVLTTYEKRNASIFDMSHSAHETFEEAKVWLIGKRQKQLLEAEKELARAKRSLSKAMSIEPKEAA